MKIISESPIALNVEDAELPRAYGPGLEHGVVNTRTTIFFDSKKSKGSLKVEIFGMFGYIKVKFYIYHVYRTFIKNEIRK